MIASEPLPHFVDDLLGYLHETHPTLRGAGRRAHSRRPPRGCEPGGDRQRNPRAIRLPAPFERNPSGSADAGRTARAPDAHREPPGPDVRARGGAHVGAQPPVLLRAHCLEPRRADAVFSLAGIRACPSRALEAAADAPFDSSRSRQRQGPAGHLRQGRYRDHARRLEVHRSRAATRVRESRRLAPARRSGRRPDRGLAGRCRLRPVPRGRGVTKSPRVVSTRAGQVRAEAASSTRASPFRSIVCSRSPSASWPKPRRNSAAWRDA